MKNNNVKQGGGQVDGARLEYVMQQSANSASPGESTAAAAEAREAVGVVPEEDSSFEKLGVWLTDGVSPQSPSACDFYQAPDSLIGLPTV